MWICWNGGLKLRKIPRIQALKLLMFLQKCSKPFSALTLDSVKCANGDLWQHAQRAVWIRCNDDIDWLFITCNIDFVGRINCLWFICIEMWWNFPLGKHQSIDKTASIGIMLSCDTIEEQFNLIETSTRALLSAQMKSLFDFSSAPSHSLRSP